MPEPELRTRCAWFPVPLPAEVVALYGWHGGQARDAWDEAYPFWFRDCACSRLERAERGYARIMQRYGAMPAYHELLKHAFPFAAFNGAWLVFPCQGQRLAGRLERPVLSVFHGMNVWFSSLERMVETCLAWVAHPHYAGHRPLPAEEERAIWQQHNPGIFGR